MQKLSDLDSSQLVTKSHFYVTLGSDRCRALILDPLL